MALTKYRAKIINKYNNTIVNIYNNGIRPVLIITQLRGMAGENLNLASITRKQIQNSLTRHRRKKLQGRTSIQFLYNQLENLTTNIFYRDLRNKKNRLVYLFITPRNKLNLFHHYPHILLLNTTYKTNRFNIPLLNIYDSTSTKKTFSITSIFLKREKIQHYF